MKSQKLVTSAFSPRIASKGVKATRVGELLRLFLILLLPALSPGQDFTCMTNNGTITITGYTSSGDDVTIPDTINGLPVTAIGGHYDFYGNWFGAFHECTSLANVTVGCNVTSIWDSAFSTCVSLKTITVDAQNAFYSSVDGVLFNKDQTTLIQYPEGKTGSYTIPNSVTSIGD